MKFYLPYNSIIVNRVEHIVIVHKPSGQDKYSKYINAPVPWMRESKNKLKS